MRRLSRLRYTLLLALWPLGKYTHRLNKLPLLGSLFAGKTTAETNEAIILPSTPTRTVVVDQAIAGTKSVALPYPLLAPLVERASARTILNECPCRRAERCTSHPHDVGCLFLGRGAAKIHPDLGRPATPYQALAHATEAMAAGLVPTVLHSVFDAYLLEIPYRRMLAICFCCDCCCTVRHSLKAGAPGFEETVIRLPGLTVEIGESCTGCGTCLSVCPAQAISLHESSRETDTSQMSFQQKRSQAHIDLERCKGCGRCASTCSSDAIHLQIVDQAATLDRLLARITRRTEIGPNAATSHPSLRSSSPD